MQTGFSFAALGLSLALIAGTGPASADQLFSAPLGLKVAAGQGNDFTVLGGANDRPSDYWCAAGVYADRVLNSPVGARVVLTRPQAQDPQKAWRRTVGFSMESGSRDDQTIYLLTLKNTGASMSVAQARSVCNYMRGRP